MSTVEFEHLEPPYEWFHPEPGEPFTLHVIRFEVGLAQRPVEDPPGYIIRPTIRFHLPEPFRPGGPPYVDFTNRGLIARVVAIYDGLIEDLRAVGLGFDAGVALGVIPEAEEPVVLKLTRYGRRIDTRYQVEILEV